MWLRNKDFAFWYYFFNDIFLSCRVPTFSGQKVVNMAVTWVSHICLFVELGPICNSMAASLCLKSCEDHSLLKSYDGGLWKKQLQVGPYTTMVIAHQTYLHLRSLTMLCNNCLIILTTNYFIGLSKVFKQRNTAICYRHFDWQLGYFPLVLRFSSQLYRSVTE